MHINFKYFIVSIGAIFLALGIGILIGSNLSSNDTIQKQNAAIAKDIDNKFNELRKKDDQLSAENSSYNESINNIKNLFKDNQNIRNIQRIDGKSIGIISFESTNDMTELKNYLTGSGGNIAFELKVKDSIISPDTIKKINEKAGTNLKNEEDLVKYIYEGLKNKNNINNLISLGLVNVSGDLAKYDQISNMLFFANLESNSIIEKIEIPLISNLKNDKRVVVLQNSSSNIDKMESFYDLKIPTINNIDEPISYITLNAIINNDKINGHFGVVNKNTLLIPEIK